MALGTVGTLATALLAAWVIQKVVSGFYNIFYHPLATFPGPKVGASTAWYKTYQEVFVGRSWVDVLQELHDKYGMQHGPATPNITTISTDDEAQAR